MNPYYRLFLLWLSLWTMWIPRRSTPFSNFIRNATPDEKAKVYDGVMDRANKRQVVELAEWRRRRTNG